MRRETTIDIQNYSESRDVVAQVARLTSAKAVIWWQSDEIARIGIDEALVFIAKQNVCRDKKTGKSTPTKDLACG